MLRGVKNLKRHSRESGNPVIMAPFAFTGCPPSRA